MLTMYTQYDLSQLFFDGIEIGFNKSNVGKDLRKYKVL